MPDKKTPDTKTEARDQAIGYILAAFGFVAGLAWNDAVKSLIDTLIPLGTNTLLAKFLYAVVVTLVVIFTSRSLIALKKSEK